jgi:Mce-associated membrane protein
MTATTKDVMAIDDAEAPSAAESPQGEPDERASPRGVRWRPNGRSRIAALFTYVVVPLLIMAAAGGAGWAKWVAVSADGAETARIEAAQVAKDATVAMLSYQPSSVDKDLDTASTRLTGEFKNSYVSLIRDVVIPGSKQKRITAVATVPAVGTVSATRDHVVTVVFVNQTTTVGDGAPTDTTSSVRVSLDKVSGIWLVSGFDPI